MAKLYTAQVVPGETCKVRFSIEKKALKIATRLSTGDWLVGGEYFRHEVVVPMLNLAYNQFMKHGITKRHKQNRDTKRGARSRGQRKKQVA